MSINKNLLIIGKPDSGKSTFITQLYKQLITHNSQVQLLKTPDNLAVIEQGGVRLSQGCSIEHTPAQSNNELVLNLRIKNDDILVCCPDYAGEQINDIISNRYIDDMWLNRITASDYWLLFIRLTKIDKELDIVNRPCQETTQKNETTVFTLSADAECIELLQMFLFHKNVGLIRNVTLPRLCLVLTCYDELESEASRNSPAGILAKHMPFFKNFIDTVWDTSSINIIGLSAQGKPLSKDKPDEEYINIGSEKFAYLIMPDKKKEEDLSILLTTVINK